MVWPLSSSGQADEARQNGDNQVTFPIPDAYSATAADITRDQEKRAKSPPSFFFGQAWGIEPDRVSRRP